MYVYSGIYTLISLYPRMPFSHTNVIINFNFVTLEVIVSFIVGEDITKNGRR